MASVVISGDTSGSITVSAPAVAGSNTITLPARTGTAITTADTATVTPTMLSQPLTEETAKASTSGTTVNFTGIPSWVKRITVMLYNVSTNGTSFFRIRIGSGSLSTSGYASYGSAIVASAVGSSASTAGFDLRTSGVAGASVSGIFTLANISGNIWVASGVLYDTDRTIHTAGSISLGGALDLLTLTTVNGTDTFDAGTVNIMYE